MLNGDYKTIEKCIANRLQPILEDYVVNEDQKGFMRGGRISVNIRKVLDLMHFAEVNKLDGIILSLDFSKCFDKIEICAITGAMEYFGFSEFLINWTKILYNNVTAMTQNNGQFSKPFHIEKGVRQGGCASTMYFLICAETLALELRNHPEIGGIMVNEIENLLGQFADDMDIYTLFQTNKLQSILDVLANFHENTGFVVNYDKTQVYRIGSLKHTNARLITQQQLVWTNEPICVLGVNITDTVEELIRINYEPLLLTVKGTLDVWRQRNLSLFGKIQIVNTLIASLFVYKMLVLPSIPEYIVKKLDDMIQVYLWNGHKPKISKKVLQGRKEDGGAGLVNFHRKDAALKTTWYQILKTDNKLANLVYQTLQPVLREDIWYCNLTPTEVDTVYGQTVNTFWADVLKAWYAIPGFEYRKPSFLWYNSQIRIGNEPVFWEDPYVKGLKYIEQLYQSGVVKSYRQVQQEFGLTLMQFNSLISAIPRDLKRRFSTCSVIDNKVTQITSSGVYGKLAQDLSLVASKHKAWEQELEIDIRFDLFLQGFTNIYKVTNVAKYRSFQYRLLNRAIITNVHLAHWGIKQTNLCTFCESEKESYLHLFIYCKYVKPIWIQLEDYMQDLAEEQITFDMDTVMWNLIIPCKPQHVKNFLCLVTKQYIYKKRCLQQNVNFQELRQTIVQIRSIEKFTAVKNNRLKKHCIKWGQTVEQEQEDPNEIINSCIERDM